MYKVVLKQSAEKDLEKINPVYYNSVTAHLMLLADNPRPFGCIKLTGYENHYRIRVGIYRVIYTIKDDILIVEVIKIDHRSRVYRQ